MQPFLSLLVAVWREACRHIQIGESAGNIARLLGEHMPVDRFALFRVAKGSDRLSLAAFAPSDHPPIAASVDPLSAGARDRLLEWIGRREVVRLVSDERAPEALQDLFGAPQEDWLVASLAEEHGPAGLLVVSAPPGQRFHDRHLPIVAALQDPLSVALDNDRRVHEMAALREAAEADKRSLLSRLGRKEMTDEIVGEATGLRLVMERVRLIANSDVPVLILGETGTGKEIVARAIHNGGGRRSGPFIRVNCGAIPRELIDSQLFGHERGSFTGAVEARQGWFERADGGTLFLDEIGELPPDAQVRFLRVLQDGFVERVGGVRPIHVDVRVVAATHRDLAEMVRQGRFREDLWYRIAVFPILLPPLRDRADDIPALVEHFARRAAARFNLAPVGARPEDVDLLRRYSWPGNIRELGAVIDRAAILGDGKSLEIAAALGFASPASNLPDSTTSSVRLAVDVGRVATLDEAMRRHIEEALRTTRGRIEGKTGAAVLLGINPHTLRARMRKLGVAWQKFRVA